MSLKIDYMRPSQSAARSTLEPRSILEDLLARSRTIKRVVSLAADIANTAENVKANKRSCVRLASSVVDCVLKIDAVTKDRWDPAPRIIKLELDQVEFLLLSILNWMRDLVEAGLFSQLLKRSHIKHKTDELRVSLLDRVSALQDSIFEEIRRTINLNDCLQVVLAHNTGLVRRLRRFQRQGDAESQPGLLQKDGDGFPVIHRSEVVLRNPQRPGGSGWEGVTEASVGGRPVLVKHYDGPGAEQRWDQDVTFLKTVWDARLPQLYGISRGGDTPLFTILHDTGHTDLQAFVSPSIQAGQLLQVAATATRVAEHLRAGLAMLASSGRWPAIYGSPNERPSLALLSSLAVNNRGIVVIGANIASDRQDANHRGPLVWLCHEVFGSRYPGTALAIGEHDQSQRARQLANQIAGSILLCGAQPPAHTASAVLADLRDSQWTPRMLRELRASMASWALDDRSGLFSNCGYGDVGFLASDSISKKRKFVTIGSVKKTLGSYQSRILGPDEPYRQRRKIDHIFEGEFTDMIVSDVSSDVTRFTFVSPSSVSFQKQFSLHEKPRDLHAANGPRWQSITSRVRSLAEEYRIPPESMIVVTGHRTSVKISSKFTCTTPSTPAEAYFFLSHEDYPASYWSYDPEFKPINQRSRLSEPQASISSSPLTEKRGFYIQFIPEDFESFLEL